MRFILNTFRNIKSLLAVIILPGILISSCGGNHRKNHEIRTVSEYSLIQRAERFSLEKRSDYTILTIKNPWQGADNVTQVYYLVKRGSEFPAGLDSSVVIFVPLKKIICMSTTHIAMIAAIGEENTIAGVSGSGFVYTKGLIENLKNGVIADVGYEANLNKELIIKISPDLIMMYGIGSESAGYIGKIQELGIRVLFNADYLEIDPLGKAEWIKLFGALYCRENLADSIYKTETTEYEKIKSFVSQNVSIRPKVLLGLPYKDTWYISPGNSFISKLITDAGGNYLWQNTESSVSMPFGIENVYLKALTADYWLNIGTAVSKSEISMLDQRLTGLPCYKKGNLFNNNKRTTHEGGNDYWESGTVYPHLILKDIASIIHPDLFAGNELLFYRKIN